MNIKTPEHFDHGDLTSFFAHMERLPEEMEHLGIHKSVEHFLQPLFTPITCIKQMIEVNLISEEIATDWLTDYTDSLDTLIKSFQDPEQPR